LSERNDSRIDCTARSIALIWSADTESQSTATRVRSGSRTLLAHARFSRPRLPARPWDVARLTLLASRFRYRAASTLLASRLARPTRITILKRICAGSCTIHNAGRPDAIASVLNFARHQPPKGAHNAHALAHVFVGVFGNKTPRVPRNRNSNLIRQIEGIDQGATEIHTARPSQALLPTTADWTIKWRPSRNV
jgi:hypothetical protein